jgi:hypothetical protein
MVDRVSIAVPSLVRWMLRATQHSGGSILFGTAEERRLHNPVNRDSLCNRCAWQSACSDYDTGEREELHRFQMGSGCSSDDFEELAPGRAPAEPLDFSTSAVDTIGMWQTALTLWFSIASVFGPSICCCSASNSLNSFGRNTSATSQKVKPCCKSNSIPGDEQSGSPSKDKPKCPCGKNGIASQALPISSESTSDVSDQHRWSDSLLVTCSQFTLAYTLRSDAVALPSWSSTPHVFGRALLTSFSTLRC